MNIQSFFKVGKDFFSTSYYIRTYQGSTSVIKQGPFSKVCQPGISFGVVCLVGLHIGKYTARYMRDHSLDPLTRSNSAVIRTACRTYNYLFPAGSGRKYFMEVALADNFFMALQLEGFLHTMPRPLDEPIGSNIEEAILSVARVIFLVYCLDKIRQIVYKTLRWVPQRHIFNFALNFAPTGVYPVTLPNREVIQYRN